MAQAGADAEFDAWAGDYEAALQKGIRLSGESSAYFAQGRIEWTGAHAARMALRCETVLDFGCGTGSATPFLLDLPGARRVIGTDVSEGLLDGARREHGSERASFVSMGAAPAGAADLAYCNGVFHHIPPAERPGAVRHVWHALRPGGAFALWENNPWNPGTRLVMHRIPFDRDAITLSPPETCRMLRDGGFAVVRTEYLFIFPSALAALRRVERRLARLPLGAQYVVLGVKPGSAAA